VGPSPPGGGDAAARSAFQDLLLAAKADAQLVQGGRGGRGLPPAGRGRGGGRSGTRVAFSAGADALAPGGRASSGRGASSSKGGASASAGGASGSVGAAGRGGSARASKRWVPVGLAASS
jgi:hypothetical protein